MQEGKPKNNKKVFIGLLSLFTFLLILFQITGSNLDLLNQKGFLSSIWQKYFSSEKSLLLKEEANKTQENSKQTLKVIDEESAIINVVEKASPSVVSIVLKQMDFNFFSGKESFTEEGIGTGFVVDPNGVIVTNSHVVNNPNGEYSVVLKDGTTYKVDKIHLDAASDLAIIEITARNLPALELADSSKLKVGQKAIAIGNALGQFQNTVTSGIVSGIGREIMASDAFGTQTSYYEEVIQTDAALNPGNSGGPLLNLLGQVIGINVATTPTADNISFAIPSNTLRPLLESFLSQGRIIRPFLGVSYQLVTKEIAKLRDMPQGAFISRVYNGSPAEKAGLRRGDIITSFNGQALDEKNTLSALISRSSVGDSVDLMVDRGGEKLKITVILEEAPENF